MNCEYDSRDHVWKWLRILEARIEKEYRAITYFGLEQDQAL